MVFEQFTKQEENENDNCFTKFVCGGFGLHCVESKL